MPTSCKTHDYDGELREKWFEMRPMLMEKYLCRCRSFEETLIEMEEWLEKKYFNVKRIGRARRSMNILRSQRRSNFDSKNEIDVEELLPILWDQVKNQEDLHDTFYEQVCDITGGSCSQGRSTRLFQFLFLFDLPSSIVNHQSETNKIDLPVTTNDPSISIEITEDQKATIEKTLPSTEESKVEQIDSPSNLTE